VNKNLFHFVCVCEELSELQNECFEQVSASDCCLIERMSEKNTCVTKQQCQYVHIGAKHRE